MSDARTRHLALLLALAGAALGGCSADRPLNPSFPLAVGDARAALREMRDEPRVPARPIVILGGIHDPGVVASQLKWKLRRATYDDAQIVAVSFLTAGTFDACRRRVLDAVERAFPSDDPSQTVEVDVVGVSMGGLVGRYAALPGHEDGRRLDVNRLFTIATPHRGARMAELPTFDKRVVDMRAGSNFLAALDAPSPDAPGLHPYTRLGDHVVGPERTAPPGRHPWWVANRPFSLAHLGAAGDPRILADIARKLRGETAYTLDPATPLPGQPSGTARLP